MFVPYRKWIIISFEFWIFLQNREEEQAAGLLPVLAEEQDITQWPWSGEETGLDYSRGPGGLRALQSRYVQIVYGRRADLFTNKLEMNIYHILCWIKIVFSWNPEISH